MAVRAKTIPTTKPRRTDLEPMAVGLGDAARMLGIGITATKKLVYSGQLRSTKVGERRIVPISAIRRFLGERD